jgi:tetratricopeptide (TPR) repeat protein
MRSRLLHFTTRVARYRRYFVALVCFVNALALPAQESMRQQLFYAYQLDQAGRFSQALAVAQPLVDTPGLNVADRSEAWALVAMAYQQEGRFQDAQRAYDRAVLLLRGQPQHLREYASVLGGFATLYRDMGQTHDSMRMEAKVANVYKLMNDPRGIAIAYEQKAELALAQGDKRQGRKDLAEATHEATLAGSIGDEFYASISATQSWLAELEGNTGEAVSGYQHALDLWTAEYGSEHPTVGWAFMLLGKAYSKAGNTSKALDEMQTGLAILERTSGRDSIKYLTADLAYAQALDSAGKHEEARWIGASTSRDLERLYRNQCMSCEVNIAALH